MRSLSVSPSTYSKTMYGAPVLLAGVDHADDVRVRELGDRARLAAEALELVGVRAISRCISLIATGRSSVVSNAR